MECLRYYFLFRNLCVEGGIVCIRIFLFFGLVIVLVALCGFLSDLMLFE